MNSAAIKAMQEASRHNSPTWSPADTIATGNDRTVRNFTASALAALSVLIALILPGCTTSGFGTSTVTLQASGEPGVTFRLRSNVDHGIERVVTVPATLAFTGRNFDLRCVHGPQAGTLTLALVRDGLSLSTGNTTRPGQVTHFKIRGRSVAASVKSVTKSSPP